MESPSFPQRIASRYTRDQWLRMGSFGLASLATALVAVMFYDLIVAFQVYVPNWDEGGHGLWALQTAGYLQAGDWTGLVAHTAARIFQPFLHGWALAPVLLAFGPTLVTARTFSMLSVALGTLVVWKLADEVTPRRGWLAGLVAVGLTLVAVPLWLEATRIHLEPFGFLLITLALWAYLRSLDSGKADPAVLASLLAVAALLEKYPFGIFVGGAIALNEVIAARFRPRRLLTRRTLWLAGPFVATLLVWEVALPGPQLGGLAGYSTYSISTPITLPTFDLNNLLYYPRSLIYEFSPTPMWGFLIVAGVLAATVAPRQPKLQAISAYFWMGMLPLTIRPFADLRSFFAIPFATFVIAGYWAARAPDLLSGLWSRLPQERRAWRVGAGVGVALMVAGGLLWPAYRTLRGTVETLPLVAGAYFDTDPLASAAIHRFAVEHIPEDERQIFAVYTSNAVNGSSLGWTLASVTRDGDIREDVTVSNAQQNFVPEPGLEADADLRESIARSGARYVVVYLIGWEEHRQHDWHLHALNLRDDLSFVATFPATDALFFEHQTEALIDNRLSADERRAMYYAFLKERPVTVDIYRFEEGGFADDPLPEIVDLLDMPDIERSYALPDPQVTLDADLGGRFTLLGYDASVTEEGPSVTLYWQTQAWSHDSFKTFVHLLNADGQRVAQYDANPRNWTYPTDLWAPGEVIDETVTFDGSDLPPGEYHFGVGMYPGPDGAVLTVTLPDGTTIDRQPLLLPTSVEVR